VCRKDKIHTFLISFEYLKDANRTSNRRHY